MRWLYIAVAIITSVNIVDANYAMGESAPMCWELKPGNPTMGCPPGLEMDWEKSTNLPETLTVGVKTEVRVSLKITQSTMDDLESKGRLGGVSAADKWATCAVTNKVCTDTSDKVNCCYFHVNIHSCLDTPGVFCGPWVGNDGFLATHTPAYSGFAGPTGEAEFGFDIKLFYEGRYMVIVHFKFAGIHFAIGKTTNVAFSSAICQTPEVPAKDGSCEKCPVGSQPLSLGIPKGGAKIKDDVAHENSLNPLCVPCPPGFYSPTGEECLPTQAGYYQDQGGQTSQKMCPTGQSNPLTGMTKCIVCSAGTFSEEGAASCSLCGVGNFTDQAGQQNCQRCPGKRTTNSMGMSTVDACICPEDTYAEENNGKCLDCVEGMTCPIGSSYDNLLLRTDANKLPVPLLKKGYYSRARPWDSTSVFSCHLEAGEKACPGGPPGTCNDGREGLVCAQCREGHSADKVHGTCVKCGETWLGIFFAVIALLLVICLIYKFCNAEFSMMTTNTLAISATGGITIMVCQVLALLPKLTIFYPNVLKSSFRAFDFLLMSPSSAASLDCFTKDATFQYLLCCLPPASCVVAVLLLYICSQAVPRPFGRWEVDKACSTLGTILQAVFVGIAILVSRPFQCYSHPNGKQSMLMYPEIVCWSGKHTSFILMGLIVGMFFVIPYCATCVFVSLKSSTAIVNQDLRFLTRVRFFMYRFKADRSWWGIVYLSRALLFAMSPLVPGDYPHMQFLYVCTVAFLYCSAIAYYWPWKNTHLCLFDLGSGFTLGVVACLSSAFLPEAKDSDAYTVIGVLLFVGIFFQTIAMLGSTGYWLYTNGATGAYGSFSDKKGATILPDVVAKFSHRVSNLESAKVASMLNGMTKVEKEVLNRIAATTLSESNKKTAPSAVQAVDPTVGPKYREIIVSDESLITTCC